MSNIEKGLRRARAALHSIESPGLQELAPLPDLGSAAVAPAPAPASGGVPAFEIERLEWEPLRGRAPDDFAIEPGTREGERQIALAPDLATCAQCRQETSDPADRRFGYAFTSCSSCGPRFTAAPRSTSPRLERRVRGPMGRV